MNIASLMNEIAPLIVCPPHIARGWQFQLEKLLSAHESKLYKFLVLDEYA